MISLGFVCTNYNNSSFTRAAITSLHQGGRQTGVKVVVVDNRSEADDVVRLRELTRDFPSVELLLNEENCGYFAGLNIGIRHLRTCFPEVRHMVVGNNDLVFPATFVPTVERHQDVFETWAVVAPDLVTPEGVHQNPHVLHPIGRTRKFIWDLYFTSYAASMIVGQAARLARRFTGRKENAMDSELHTAPGLIEQGYGACYLLGPVFFRHFTHLCAPTFMMQEEFFLCEQLKTIGQATYFDPRFLVYHEGHASMGRVPSRRHWEISRTAHVTYKRYLALGPGERAHFIAVRSREQA